MVSETLSPAGIECYQLAVGEALFIQFLPVYNLYRNVNRFVVVLLLFYCGTQQVMKNMELEEGTKGTKGANGTKDTKDTKGPCDYPREGRRDSLELIPNPEQAKFIALGAQLVIIRDLCQQDLRFKVRPEEGLTQYKLDICFYQRGFTTAITIYILPLNL